MFLYFCIFPSDAMRYKILVAWLWCMDTLHTVFICVTCWDYIIINFTNPKIVLHIFPTIVLLVLTTGIITLSVHTFYTWRIYKLSKHSWWIAGPIALLSLSRLAIVLANTILTLKSKNFLDFAVKWKHLFISGLLLSASTDILISIARCYYVRNLKQGYFQSKEIVDSVVVYTVNDGILSCAFVIATSACAQWVSMPHNFIYLAIYMAIAKLYANSVLATLNMRNWFRHRYNYPRPMDIVMSRSNGITGVHVNEHPHSMTMPTHSSKPSQPIYKPPVMDIDGSRVGLLRPSSDIILTFTAWIET
ncbi:hypothetical protein OF83DRAFT_1178869 [Amylostereum chailletii]|nr:hypothetical protein OF83DRAFT_1178869 [Amylostereum chailletii]